MTIIGIDPATRTGYATSSGVCGVWELRKHRLDERGLLLVRFGDHFAGLLAQCEPVSLVAIEAASFGANNRNTAAFHNELRGVARYVATLRGSIPVRELVPSSLKKYATGNGRADKRQMVAMARELGCPYDDDDIVDAWFLCRWGVDASSANSGDEVARATKTSAPF